MNWLSASGSGLAQDAPSSEPRILASEFRTSNHPRVYATTADRVLLWDKIQKTGWAGNIYHDLKAEVDPLVARHVSDPEWIVSRLQMHWEKGKHFTRFASEQNFIPWREGNAPYPTVRVTYGRSAAGAVSAPGDLGRLTSYGNGELPLLRDGNWMMVPFEKTQLGAEIVNQTLLTHAYRAAIVYYFTGDKKYAKFAADILWVFVRGAAQQEQVNPDEAYNANGYLSWETIGDTRRFATLPIAYDLIYDYLTGEYFESDEFKNGRHDEPWAPGHPQGNAWALAQFEIMFKKFIENKLTRGGGLVGNWNTNEHQSAMLYALALDNDDHYADKRGREYYVGKLVYGPTTRSHGAYVDVAKANINADTGLWPEAPGTYGQGSVEQLIRLGFVYFVNGLDFIRREPLLAKGAASFPLVAFPNGISTGWGDSNYRPPVTEQAELMIAYARARGDAALENTFTNLLAFAGERRFEGQYFSPLFFYVPELKPVTGRIEYPRVSYSAEHSLVFGRNLGATARESLAYSVGGSGLRAAHRQENGITIELFGRGHVLGVDPGIAHDYWEKQHMRYNGQFAAHNTVAPNGVPMAPGSPLDLVIENCDPAVVPGASRANGVSDLCQFTDTSGEYHGSDGLIADQRRVVGIVRTSNAGGYFVDIFRSRAREGYENKFHDYLYHNMGRSLALRDSDGKLLPLAEEPLDPQSGFGYEYFQGDRSLIYSGGLHATFDFGIDHIQMHLWMPGSGARTVFSLTAPNNFRYYLPELHDQRVPTLLVRQTGEAWQRPFVAIFEPSGDGAASSIKNVRRLRDVPLAGDLVGLAVEHLEPGRLDFVLNATDGHAAHRVEGVEFKGTYGVAAFDVRGVKYLYLGTGEYLIASDGIGLTSSMCGSAKAVLVNNGSDFSYTAETSIVVRLPWAKANTGEVAPSVFYRTKQGRWPALGATVANGVLIIQLPPMVDAHLEVEPAKEKRL